MLGKKKCGGAPPNSPLKTPFSILCVIPETRDPVVTHMKGDPAEHESFPYCGNDMVGWSLTKIKRCYHRVN